MIEHLYLCQTKIQHYRKGPYADHVDAFAGALLAKGYSMHAARRKMQIAADLCKWIKRGRAKIEDLDERRAAEFLRARVNRGVAFHRHAPAALRQFIEHLRDAGIIPVPAQEIDDSEICRMTNAYAQYLLKERGLAQATLGNYIREARRFLSDRFGGGAIKPDELRQEDINRYILRRARAVSPGRAKITVTVLRSFLRFLHQHGETAINLSLAVPAVAMWRFSELPEYLEPDQVERILESCDRNTSAGLRDYAILLLLARLGLRPGEVANITMDDIDWKAGELIARGKSVRHDRLPLPHDVGEALAAYLRHGRPRCSSRRIFIRVNAPHQGFTDSVAVCDIVGRALSRAGINHRRRGAGLLRHSLATRMLRGGASLSEIGEILRHQLPTTTEIYAKVDIASLRTLAQPWPGGGA